MDGICRKKLIFLLFSIILVGNGTLVYASTMNAREKHNTISLENTLLNNKGINSFESGLIKVTNNNGNNYNPSIFVDALGRLWMIWSNGSGNDGIIWATHSSEPFDIWTEPFRLTHDPADDWNPVGMTDKRGVLWIFWQSNRNGNYDIWYKYSNDNGGIWSNAFQLTDQITDETRPTAIVDHSDSLWVFFEMESGGDKEIVYKKTPSESRVWEDHQVITISDPSRQEELYDACISEDGTIYLFIQELVDKWATLTWISNDGGLTWEKNQVTTYDNCGWGTLFLGSSTIYLVYEQNMKLYLTSSTISELNWSTSTSITSKEDFNLQPQACTGLKTFFLITWSSNQTGNWEIYLKAFKSEEGIYSAGNASFPLPIIVLFALFGSSLLLILVFMNLLLNYQNRQSRIKLDDTVLQKALSLFFLGFGNVIGPRLRRMSVSQVQENEVRTEILNLLTTNEFMHLREIQRQTQTGMAHLKWHLLVLIDFGLIKEKKVGQYLIYHLTVNPPNPLYLYVYFNLFTITSFNVAEAFVKFRKWEIRELSTYLIKSRKLTKYHCEKLVKLGILAKEKENSFYLPEKYREPVTKVLARRITEENR